MTLDELDAAREWMLLLGRKTAREKIASLLAIIARRDAALQAGGEAGRAGVRPAPDAGGDGGLSGPDAGNGQPADFGAEEGRRHQPAEGNRHVTVPDLDRLLEEAGDDSDGGYLT